MLCWGRQLFIVIVIILGIGQMMAACGQKGPLYLPDDQA
ncbi:MAG TPA: lipoprotein, partial [Chromatiaceae bacterium]|nr:lipoprotein [Chromatiaceae bacterium]